MTDDLDDLDLHLAEWDSVQDELDRARLAKTKAEAMRIHAEALRIRIAVVKQLDKLSAPQKEWVLKDKFCQTDTEKEEDE